MAGSGEARRPAGREAEPTRPLQGVPGGVMRPDELDRLIHQRTRLGIVSALAAAGRMSFNDLKASLRTTDGNLSVHARKLEDAGYVKCLKSFEGRVPHTEYELTPKGRKSLDRYLEHMEALIAMTRER